MEKTTLDLAVIVAGPTGIDAGLGALQRNLDVQIFEKGKIGNHLLQWHGVKMFTPFEMNRSEASIKFSNNQGLTPPESSAYLTGKKFVREWLSPLVQETPLNDVVRIRTEVKSITREEFLKGERIGCDRRANHPFRLVLENTSEDVVHFDSVIDASGPFGNLDLSERVVRLLQAKAWSTSVPNDSFLNNPGLMIGR